MRKLFAWWWDVRHPDTKVTPAWLQEQRYAESKVPPEAAPWKWPVIKD